MSLQGRHRDQCWGGGIPAHSDKANAQLAFISTVYLKYATKEDESWQKK